MEFYLLVFNNTHEAMEAESFLKDKAVANRVMPTPTNITKSCGISLKIEINDKDLIIGYLEKGDLKLKNLYHSLNREYTVVK